MASGIYKILNTINGKFYIGSAVNISQRWNLHTSQLNNLKHNNKHLQAAWNKYGPENFEFIALEAVIKKELLKAEQFWINNTRCYDREIGYNLTPTAGSNFGRKQSKEEIEKRTKAIKGLKRSEEIKARLSALKKGTAFSEKAKQRRLLAITGKSLSKEHKKKLSDALKGTKRSEETKKKMSAWQIGRILTNEHKEKISLSRVGNSYRRRNDLWPHKDGCECKCDECFTKRRDRKKNWDLARKSKNEKNSNSKINAN